MRKVDFWLTRALGIAIMLVFTISAAQVILVTPTTEGRGFAVPGSELNFSFVDAEGRNVPLPTSGRYLLWFIDSSYAADSRARIPWSDLGGVGDDLVSNPFALALNFDESYVVIYEGGSELPNSEARLQLAAQLGGHTVLFDESGALDITVTDAIGRTVRPLILGLYLMEGSVVRYRYPFPFMWENVGILELIQEAAETFLAGGEPTLAPVAATRGGRLSDSVQLTLPALVLRTTAEALAARRLISPIVPIGGQVVLTTAEMGRFLLERLPAVLEQYGVQGVALIDDAADAATFDALREAFPGWTFIDMSVPEVRLLWLEVQTIVIDAEGQVLGSAILAPADGQGRYPNWLPDILQEASRR